MSSSDFNGTDLIVLAALGIVTYWLVERYASKGTGYDVWSDPSLAPVDITPQRVMIDVPNQEPLILRGSEIS